jgi:hypothetical protein
MKVTRFIALTATVATLPAAVLAKDAQANFWLKGNPNNIQGCIAFDPGRPGRGDFAWRPQHQAEPYTAECL